MSYARGQMFSALGARIANIGTMIQQSREAAELRAEQKTERDRLIRRQEVADAQALVDRADDRVVALNAAGGGTGPLPNLPRTYSSVPMPESGTTGSTSPLAPMPPTMRAPRLPEPNTRDYTPLPGGGYVPKPEYAAKSALASRLSGMQQEAELKADIERRYPEPENFTRTVNTRDGIVEIGNRGTTRPLTVNGKPQFPVPRATPQARSAEPTPTSQFTAQKERAKGLLDELRQVDTWVQAQEYPPPSQDIIGRRQQAFDRWGFKDEKEAQAAYSYQPAPSAGPRANTPNVAPNVTSMRRQIQNDPNLTPTERADLLARLPKGH